MKRPMHMNMGFRQTQQNVSYGGFLMIANSNHYAGSRVAPVHALSRPGTSSWVPKTIVEESAKARVFVSYGDAHPGDVSPLIFNHAEMGMAETRAVNRALRKAYGIALCSVEEPPPWATTREQIPQLRLTLQSWSPSKKGDSCARPNPRAQSIERNNPSHRKPVSSPLGPLRARWKFWRLAPKKSSSGPILPGMLWIWNTSARAHA